MVKSFRFRGLGTIKKAATATKMTTTMLACSSGGGVSCCNGRGCCRRRMVTAQGRSLASGVLVSLAGLMRISAQFGVQGSGCSGGLSTVFGDGGVR